MQDTATIHIVDDDEAMRKSLSMLMKSIDYDVKSYQSAEQFLDEFTPSERCCILLDVRMPGLSGPMLQEILPEKNISAPVIMMTGYGDIPTAVSCMKAGAIDFVEKPFDHEVLIKTIGKCVDMSTSPKLTTKKAESQQKLSQLTKREREIFDLLVEGLINKTIANKLNLSIRTVEAHRANIMEKLKTKSLSDLVKFSIYAQLS